MSAGSKIKRNGTTAKVASCRRQPAGHALMLARTSFSRPATAPPGWGSLVLDLNRTGDRPVRGHVVVDEHPHHLTNGVAFADEPGTCCNPAPRTPPDQAGDIHEGDRRGYDSLQSKSSASVSQAGIG